MESANYQRVAAVRGREGSGAACTAEKRGPRGAQSGVWDGGRRAGEKKSGVGKQGVASFCEKKILPDGKKFVLLQPLSRETGAPQRQKKKHDLLAQLV